MHLNATFRPNSIINTCLFLLSILLLFGCSSNDSESSNKLPYVITRPAINITANSATSGGEIINNDNSVISKKGIVYGLNSNPTIDSGTTLYNSSNENDFEVNIIDLTPKTTYHLRAFASNSNGTSYGENITFTTEDSENKTLTVVTTPITIDRYNSFLSGGVITSSTPIIGRGISVSKQPNPTVKSTNEGSGDGSFTSRYYPELATTYYIRAYAYDASGVIVYGNEIEYTTISSIYSNGEGVQDYDGNSYPTIKINNQEWMQKNLNVSHFRNGDIIPQIQDPVEWFNATTPAWCYYENDSQNGPTYGKLYNFYAVQDSRGLAPEGWHIPNTLEYTRLISFLDLSIPDFQGGALKETGVDHWESPNPGATNISGFTALPAGSRSFTVSNNIPQSSHFSEKGRSAWFWTTDPFGEDINNKSAINIRNSHSSSSHISFYHLIGGLSVRCIKD